MLADLIDEIMNQQRRGEPVRLEDYAAKYPDHIQQLEQLFPALAGPGRSLAIRLSAW